MILNKKIWPILLSMAVVIVAAINGCTKDNTIIIPSVSKFVAPSTTYNTTSLAYVNSYYITNSTSSVFKIPVGITTPASVDRKITFVASSSTGAASGVQYTLPSSTVTIPAGKVVDSLAVNGIFAGYPTGRKDTLTLSISGGDVGIFSAYSTYKLVMQGYCDVVASNLSGNFVNSTDTYSGAASTKPNYTASISSWTPLTATTATVIIKNMGATSDNGWGPFRPTDGSTTGILATLNWSNPANFSVTIANQNYFNDGSGQSTITATGTFSACSSTFTITCKVVYAGDGKTYTHVSTLKR